jgi:hypothetical protein
MLTADVAGGFEVVRLAVRGWLGWSRDHVLAVAGAGADGMARGGRDHRMMMQFLNSEAPT